MGAREHRQGAAKAWRKNTRARYKARRAPRAPPACSWQARAASDVRGRPPRRAGRLREHVHPLRRLPRPRQSGRAQPTTRLLPRQRCAASACSLLRWPSVRRHPIIYLVDDALPAPLRFAFRRNSISLLNVSIGAWPSTSRYPRAPPRLYSFHKLALWRLGGHFDRVVFYDSDAFFANDPARLLRITSYDTVALWATRMPAPPSKWKKKAPAEIVERGENTDQERRRGG